MDSLSVWACVSDVCISNHDFYLKKLKYYFTLLDLNGVKLIW